MSLNTSEAKPTVIADQQTNHDLFPHRSFNNHSFTWLTGLVVERWVKAKGTNKVEWEPIETAPRDGVVIMGWIGVPWLFTWSNETECWHGVVPHDDGYALMWVRSVKYNQPTHWMPLTEPPEGK